MSNYTMTGKVNRIIEETGTSKKGDSWNKSTVVVDNGSEYNNLVPVVFFGDKASNADCAEGDKVEVTFYVGGREWQNRFFADISGDTLKVLESTGSKTAAPAARQTQQEVFDNSSEDSLPF